MEILPAKNQGFGQSQCSHWQMFTNVKNWEIMDQILPSRRFSNTFDIESCNSTHQIQPIELRNWNHLKYLFPGTLCGRVDPGGWYEIRGWCEEESWRQSPWSLFTGGWSEADVKRRVGGKVPGPYSLEADPRSEAGGKLAAKSLVCHWLKWTKEVNTRFSLARKSYHSWKFCFLIGRNFLLLLILLNY